MVKFRNLSFLFPPTLLPCPVENLDVFQLNTNACPELHSISSVVFVASLDGAICMGSKQQTKTLRVSEQHNTIMNLPRDFKASMYLKIPVNQTAMGDGSPMNKSITKLTGHSSRCIPQKQTQQTCPCCCLPAPAPCSLRSPGLFAQSCLCEHRTNKANPPAEKSTNMTVFQKCMRETDAVTLLVMFLLV